MVYTIQRLRWYSDTSFCKNHSLYKTTRLLPKGRSSCPLALAIALITSSGLALDASDKVCLLHRSDAIASKPAPTGDGKTHKKKALPETGEGLFD